MRKQRQCVRLLWIALSAVGLVWSQSSFTASVRGVVSDSSGAVIAGAKVTVTEAERNVPHAVMADESGRYAVPALPPGKYSLTVEAPGFKKYTQTNIPLAVQQQATFNVSLQVGELSTTVEVEEPGATAEHHDFHARPGDREPVHDGIAEHRTQSSQPAESDVPAW